VGIDLIEPRRLEAALERHPALLDRLFTAGERAYAAGRARPILHLAARFSAKEAAAKALRLGAFEWREIEVLGGSAGARLALHGRAEERRRELGVEVALSLTHVEAMAGAVVALVPRDLDGLSRRTTKDPALPGRIRGHEDGEDGHQRRCPHRRDGSGTIVRSSRAVLPSPPPETRDGGHTSRVTRRGTIELQGG